ncbi:MAG: T9SS sorting signal type C domain-containing protein [Flavobacterium sp.]|nr:T9SS sorting signal type C domain-containing protein [Flavobacterium sp.]
MKRILFVFLIIPVLSFAQLSGNYVVGTSQSAPYNTLANAIAKINSDGVSGPVTFLIDNDQTPSSAIVINQFSGTSATNTLTIRPNTGKTVSITAIVTSGATIQLNGADNIIIDGNNGASDKQLTVYNNFSDSGNSYTQRAAIWLYNTATNNKFKNLIVKTNIVDISAGTLSVGIYAGGSSLGNAANNASNEVTNNTFTNVKQGVYVNGTSSSNTGWTVSNNIIGSTTDSSKPYVGIYFINAASYTISGNTLAGIKRPNGVGGSPFHSAIYVTGSTSGTISSNTLSNIENTTGDGICYGIYVSGNTTIINDNAISNLYSTSSNDGHAGISSIGNNATIYNNKVYTVQITQGKLINGIYASGDTQTIYNNMIANVSSAGGGDPGSQSGNGIYINSGSGVKIYHNTVRQSVNQTSGASACLYIKGGSGFDIRNNILINAQTSGSTRFAIYTEVTDTSAFSFIDYNDYSGQYIGSFGSFYTVTNLKSTVLLWALATTKDSHSFTVVPVFTNNASDLHIDATNSGNLTNLDAKGIAPLTTSITTDIDADTRNTSTPDVGADEFGPKCAGTATTWASNVWSNGTPSATVKAIINADYSGADFAACELVINTGKVLTINTGKTITVQNDITLNGTAQLIVADDGSLVQVSDSATNTGAIKVQRQTTALKQYDYTYWSAPVASQTLNVLANGDQSVFYSFDTAVNNWTYLESSTTMTAAKGYISRAPENLNFSNNNTPSYTVNFNGLQNTGVIKINVVKSGTYADNLIGNPYPSAVDAKKFIEANATKISGTLYFWTHKSAISASIPGNQTFNYTADDYAKYNLTGGVGTGTAPVSDPSNNNLKPNGYIASGQAFFVEALTSGTAEVSFNNAMRTGGSNNGQFFRSANTLEDPVGTANDGRLWLNISNTEGAYSEMLLGYVDGATNSLDNLYDGKTMDAGNYVALYTILETQPLAIQGRGLPFSNADVIPLGFNTAINGNFSITMNDFDGFFMDQNVYLYDNTNDVITNLHDGPYTFNSEIGTFNDRFELRFTNTTLGTEIPVLDKNDIGVIRDGNQIQIKSKAQNIASVTVYDLLGRVVFEKNKIENTDFTTNDLSVHNQVVVVKIKTENNLEMVQKVIMN